MSYKSILVHLDQSERCAQRIDLAAKLALDFDAHLIGLAVAWAPAMPGQVRLELGEERMERFSRARHEIAEAIGAEFERRAASVGVTKLETRIADMPSEDAVCLHGRYVDLIVLGQSDPDDDSLPEGESFPELVVLRCGRPVLVVPYCGSFPNVGHNVLLAWNASREATRAATDAVPLLQRAHKVSVYVAKSEETYDGHGEAPGADMALYLSRHGVKAEAVRSHPGDIDVGNWLLSRAADNDADLIVMGAYGHSRLRELVLGGVTRTLFKHMTVPLLMAH